jgi:hypothetical protein
VILVSVGDLSCCGYARSAALYATVDNSNVLITSSNGVPLMIPTKSMGKCIVHRILNDFNAGGNRVELVSPVLQ